MVWSRVTPDSVNLAYLFLGAFTSIFILFSGLIKNKLYLGEANVAFLTGILFGPRAANLFDPTKWHNPDIIILECTRVVLVIQCFAVAVQLRKRYVEREWRSLAWMLLPVMVWGWVISSVGIRIMARQLSWKECMACAACFNAIDPILAATVISGKAAERVPKHLRDLLLAESACNDVTTTLALELSTQVIQYSKAPRTVAFRFFVLTIGYEVLFGALAGLMIGAAAHWTVKAAMRRSTMDRQSFLSFYFVLALFCTGVGALLGVDEILLGFCAGYTFDLDDWFQDETEESDVSNVIDLLLNLTFFVLMGSIIPWQSYNAPSLGIVPWRLVAGTFIILFFRRLPIVLILQKLIPATTTWRESLLVGHFGPIGGGAIFSALVIKVQLESGGSRGDESEASSTGTPFHELTSTIWPIVTFVVLCSSIMHGTTVPAFLLGRQVTTFGVAVSIGSDSESSWMKRLPQLAGSPSIRRTRSSSLTQSERRSGFFSMQIPQNAVLGRDRSPAPSRRRERQKYQGDILSITPTRAYHYGTTIIVEDQAGRVLKQDTTRPDELGPSVFNKMKIMLQGKHIQNLPRLVVSGPGEVVSAMQSSAGPQSGSHTITKDEVLRKIRDMYPDMEVRAAEEEVPKSGHSLQVSPSAVYFQQRRRSISFEDEQEGERGLSCRASLSGSTSSRRPSDAGSSSSSTYLRPPAPVAHPDSNMWAGSLDDHSLKEIPMVGHNQQGRFPPKRNLW